MREYGCAVVDLDAGHSGWLVRAVADSTEQAHDWIDERAKTVDARTLVVVPWSPVIADQVRRQEGWDSMALPKIVEIPHPYRSVGLDELWDVVVGSCELGFDGCPLIEDWDGSLEFVSGDEGGSEVSNWRLITVTQPGGETVKYRLELSRV